MSGYVNGPLPPESLIGALHDRPRLPIGHDIDLLCEAVTWIVSKRRSTSQRNIQRNMRVGFAKAQRLLLLMDDYGITDGPPLASGSPVAVLVCGQLTQLGELGFKLVSADQDGDR